MDRLCDSCQKEMDQGYCINGGEQYFCNEKCLHSQIDKEEYERLHKDGDCDTYWTIWD